MRGAFNDIIEKTPPATKSTIFRPRQKSSPERKKMSYVQPCACCKKDCVTECANCGTPYCGAECIQKDCECHDAVCACIHDNDFVGVSVSSKLLGKMESGGKTPETSGTIPIDEATFSQNSSGEKWVSYYKKQYPDLKIYGIHKFVLGLFTRKLAKIRFVPVAVEAYNGTVYLVLVSEYEARKKEDSFPKYKAAIEKKVQAKMDQVFETAINYMAKNPHNMDRWLRAAEAKAVKQAKK